MNSLFHLIFNNDTYKVLVNGHQIVRISKYPDGSGQRIDVDFDSCPEPVKSAILQQVDSIINQNL